MQDRDRADQEQTSDEQVRNGAPGAGAHDFSDYEAARGRRSDASTAKGGGDEGLARAMGAAIEQIKSAPSNRGGGSGVLLQKPWLLFVAPRQDATAELLRGALRGPLSEPDAADTAAEAWWRWWILDSFIGIEAAPAVLHRAVESGTQSPANVAANLLIRARRPWPLDGLIIALDVEDLIAGGDLVEDLGRKARRLVNLYYDAMEVRFPVFLCCTGIERLEGHERFFSLMPRDVANTALGYRVPEGDAVAHPASGLCKGFDEVLDRLKRARLSIFGEMTEPSDVQGIFAFPEHFARMRPGIQALAGQFLEAGPHDHTPMFRGIYFVAPNAGIPHVVGLFTRFLPADAHLTQRFG